MNKTGIIYGINGPVIYLKGDSGFKISEMVYVGKDHLVGEVIGLKKGMTRRNNRASSGRNRYRYRRCYFRTSRTGYHPQYF